MYKNTHIHTYLYMQLLLTWGFANNRAHDQVNRIDYYTYFCPPGWKKIVFSLYKTTEVVFASSMRKAWLCSFKDHFVYAAFLNPARSAHLHLHCSSSLGVNTVKHVAFTSLCFASLTTFIDLLSGHCTAQASVSVRGFAAAAASSVAAAGQDCLPPPQWFYQAL